MVTLGTIGTIGTIGTSNGESAMKERAHLAFFERIRLENNYASH
jgi:hypothetical protein